MAAILIQLPADKIQIHDNRHLVNHRVLSKCTTFQEFWAKTACPAESEFCLKVSLSGVIRVDNVVIGTGSRLLVIYRKNIVKCLKLWYAFGMLIDNQSRMDFQSLFCQYVEGIEKSRLYELEASMQI